MSACSGQQKETSDETQKAAQTHTAFDTAKASIDTITLVEHYTSTLEAKVQNNISAQSGGRLSALNVEIGQRVQAGQVVARLEATQLTSAQIQLDDAKLNLKRMEELYKIGGVSQAQWEQARSAAAIAQQTVSNLAMNTVLRSPISGVVTAKNYERGDMTSPTMPVLVIQQISPIKATINVSERHYAQLKVGQRAKLSVEALGGAEFSAQVSKIYPTIDTRTHTVAVELEVSNPELVLRPGMYASLELDLGRQATLLVPDKAVQRALGAGTRYVYVLVDGKAVYRVVEIGEKYGDKQEILSGLEPGDEVLTSGFANVTNGQKL